MAFHASSSDIMAESLTSHLSLTGSSLDEGRLVIAGIYRGFALHRGRTRTQYWLGEGETASLVSGYVFSLHSHKQHLLHCNNSPQPREETDANSSVWGPAACSQTLFFTSLVRQDDGLAADDAPPSWRGPLFGPYLFLAGPTIV